MVGLLLAKKIIPARGGVERTGINVWLLFQEKGFGKSPHPARRPGEG